MKQFIICLLSLSITNIYAQSISFNNYTSTTNNDLVNNFEGSYSYTQLTSNGITGGCIDIPHASISSGAMHKLKSPWKFTQAKPMKASISFKYIAAPDLMNSVYPACKIELRQYDSASGSMLTKAVQVFCDFEQLSLTYPYGIKSETYNPLFMHLPDSWYKLDMEVYYLNQTVYITTNLNSLGANGLATPSLVRTVSMILNSTFPEDPSVYYQCSIYGNYTNGCEYLDNFNIDMNQATGIEESNLTNDNSIQYSNGKLSINQSKGVSSKLKLYNSFGQCISILKIEDAWVIKDISSLRSGLYFVELIDNYGKPIRNLKFVKAD